MTGFKKRERATGRMFAAICTEILELAPGEILAWPELGSYVQATDLELIRTAGRYEEGGATKGQVLAAAEAARASWRRAAEVYAAELAR